jgi:drug/metabolite transporter (DMT)-like permease
VDAARLGDDALLALAGMLAVALATVFYAVASVYTRRRLSGHAIVRLSDGSRRAPTPTEISFGSVFSAFLIITGMAAIFERPADGLYALPSSGAGWLAMIWLGALGTGVAYLLFFRIIERWGATRTTLVTYVIPVVAIVLGFVFLGERLRPLELAGAALIIGGVVMVNSNIGQRPLFGRAAAEARARTEAEVE